MIFEKYLFLFDLNSKHLYQYCYEVNVKKKLY